MERVAGFYLLFLLLLAGRSCGTSADRGEGSRYNAFKRCVLQNVLFPMNARGYHKQKTAPLTGSNIHRGSSETELRIKETDFGSEIFAREAAPFQASDLVPIFAVCYRSVPELASTKSSAEIMQFVSMFIRNEVTAMNPSDEYDLAERESKVSFKSLPLYFMNSYRKGLNTNIGVVVPQQLLQHIADCVTKYDPFRSPSEMGISLEAVSLIATALSTVPTQKDASSDAYRNTLMRAIYDLDDSAYDHLRPREIVSCVAEELSSYGSFNDKVETHPRLLGALLLHSASLSERNDIGSLPQARRRSYADVTQRSSPPATNGKIQSILSRRKRESDSVEEQDLHNCANTVKATKSNDTTVWRICRKIFQRGVWDAKADRTLDGDIRNLIQLMYDGKRENLAKVLDFIDKHVPKFVREQIVSYDTIINEFELNDDFKLPVNRPQFQRIKTAVGKIKSMNGGRPAEKYLWAKQIHKDMLENMLVNLESITKSEDTSKISKNESVTITNKILQNCSNSVELFPENKAKIRESCNIIFSRGIWDKKADKTLNGDIRKLIRFIYDDNRKNFVKVLNFIDKYVPKRVRDLIVSYDTLINVFEERQNFNQPTNKPYFQKIRTAVTKIKSMDGDHPEGKYEMARKIEKDMLQNMLVKLKLAKKESITITDGDIRKCVKVFRLDSNETEGLLPCTKIFHRGVWDAKADRTLDGDIRRLITLIYDGKRVNLVKVLNFIDSYVPKYVRELIVSYDTIITDFILNDDFNLPVNQPQLLRIKTAVRKIKSMNNWPPAQKYLWAKQVHKDMLECMLVNLESITKPEGTSEISKNESFTVTNKILQNCSNVVKMFSADETKVQESCDIIFNRGVWDEKADKTLNGDIRKLIIFIYGDDRSNFVKVLNFIDKYVPKRVRDLTVSYDSLINVFEEREDITQSIDKPYIQKIRTALINIKSMDGDSPVEKYEMARQIDKDMLQNMMVKLNLAKRESITITDEDIRNCATDIRQHSDETSLSLCAKIFQRGVWDAKADRTLDGDIRKLMTLTYNGKRKYIVRLLNYVDRFVPKYVRELIVSYDTIITEFELNDDFNLPVNRPLLQRIKTAVEKIKDMNGGHPAEKYLWAKQVHKDMLENMLVNMESVTKSEDTSEISKNESITITNESIRNCSDTVKQFSEDGAKVRESCSKIFSRGIWDEKADKTLNGDIRKLIIFIYDDDRSNFVKVLNFIDKYVPKRVRDLIVCYDTLVNVFEEREDFNWSTNKPYFQKIRTAVTKIKSMDGDHPEERYEMARQIEKDRLQNMLVKLNLEKRESITITDEDIRSCAAAIKAGLNETEALMPCVKIFHRGVWDAKADKTLDGDIRKVMTLIYNNQRENLVKVLNFIDSYVPKYVRELIVSYDTIIKEFEKFDDFNLPINRPHFQRIKTAVEKIKSMNGDHPAEKYLWAKQIHKDMLENILVNLETVAKAESTSEFSENEIITVGN